MSRYAFVLFTFLIGAGFSPAAVAAPQLSDAYGRLNLHFEANQGQAHEDVRFLARGPGYSLYLTRREAVFVLTKPRRAEAPGRRLVLRMSAIGGRCDNAVSGLDELPGKANYFIGKDPAKWRTNIPTYARVQYRDVYPGIDLVYYGNQRQLEYDFVVAPGTDPQSIVLRFEGADKVEVDAHGDLILHAGADRLRQRKPLIYQEVDGLRREIEGRYVLKGEDRVGFAVSSYDVERPLVLDPVLFYSTYLGGSASDQGYAITVDGVGNAYVTGATESADFPTTPGAFDTTSNGGDDVFITKLNPTGSGLIYSTYVGGSGVDEGLGIALDAAGSAYITGVTQSTDFPTTAGAFQPTYGGGIQDDFVLKLDPSGAALLYSTYLGGNDGDWGGSAIAVDTAGNAYVVGATNSSNFPVTLGAFQTSLKGPQDATVTKINSTGSVLLYSTYLGGHNQFAVAENAFSVAIDAVGQAYVAGRTPSTDFPITVGAFQAAYGGGSHDVFITKFNASGTGLVYSTFVGGNDFEEAHGIAIDAAGNAYAAGLTSSTNFPSTPAAFQTAFAGGQYDGFVTKLNSTGSLLLYSTYLGGSGSDGIGVEGGSGIALDAAGNAHVTGFTDSTNFPVQNAIQNALAGARDAFVTKINPMGTGLVYSTYLGGTGDDFGSSIALDSLPAPNAYVVGATASTNFPTTPGAFQTANAGNYDAFVAKITDIVLPPPPTVGKVTGGGSIDVAGGIGTFGLIVQRQAVDESIRGHLQYVNHSTSAKVQSVLFTTFVITGNSATFGGTCTQDGMPCTFNVEVQDNGEPGQNDKFTIVVNAGPPEGGTLRSGNIQIHDD